MAAPASAAPASVLGSTGLVTVHAGLRSRSFEQRMALHSSSINSIGIGGIEGCSALPMRGGHGLTFADATTAVANAQAQYAASDFYGVSMSEEGAPSSQARRTSREFEAGQPSMPSASPSAGRKRRELEPLEGLGVRV